MEIWLKIKGFENYFISNLGNVKNKRQKILKVRPTKFNYLRICLTKNNKQYHFYIHRLVAIAFIDNVKNKKEINHKNLNVEDNRVENLEWCTRSENIIHSYKNGRNKKGTKIKRIGKDIKIYNRIIEAAKENNIMRQSINNCLKNKSKNAGGYNWEYI